MPDVPDDAVGLRIERLAERHRQFDGTERRRQVASVLGDRGKDPVPDFLRRHFATFFLRISRDVEFWPKASS